MIDAVLVALEREASIVRAAARARHARIALEVSGMGPVRARIAALRQVDAGATSLISVGFAGALRGPLRVGDVLLPHKVFDASGRQYMVDSALHDQLDDAIGARLALRSCALVSTEQVVKSASAKFALAHELDADAVDMESAAVAAVAADARIPFAVLRVVCDGPQQHLPSCTSAALDARGRVIAARLACGLVLRPWESVSLLRLGVSSVHAGRVLARALDCVFLEHIVDEQGR